MSLSEALAALERLTPDSRQDMVTVIGGILGRRGSVQVIDTHNTASVLFVFSIDGRTYILKAEQGAVDATRREISWYRAVGSASPTPTCLYTYDSPSFCFLVLEYIAGALTLDEIAVSNAHSDRQLIQYIDDVLAKNREIFERSNPVELSYAEADRLLLGKYDDRKRQLQIHPYIWSLVDSPTITINGAEYHTPDYYIGLIRGSGRLHDYLTPRRAGLIHGDLHLGNILVRGNDLYLVDPNTAAPLPLEYDYGKLLHSVHGGYGQIMRGSFQLVQHGLNNFAFAISMPSSLKASQRHLQSVLTEQQLLRGLYAEALHFATMLPNHVAVRAETTALFLRCTILFHELFQQFHIRSLL